MEENVHYLGGGPRGHGPEWDEGWTGWDTPAPDPGEDYRDPYRDGHFDMYADPYEAQWSRNRYYDDLGELTHVVLIDDTVVGSFRRPVRGSGYEEAARELGRPRPEPQPRTVEVDRDPRWSTELAWLGRLVGGPERLEALTDEALPDEPLATSLVPPRFRERVERIATVADRACDALDDLELRTACRRALVRAVETTPALLLLESADGPLGAALVYGVAKANGITGSGAPVTMRVVAEACGLPGQLSSDRATRWVHAVGGATALHGQGLYRRDPDVPVLGAPDLLVSAFRRNVLILRDLATAERDRLAAG